MHGVIGQLATALENSWDDSAAHCMASNGVPSGCI